MISKIKAPRKLYSLQTFGLRPQYKSGLLEWYLLSSDTYYRKFLLSHKMGSSEMSAPTSDRSTPLSDFVSETEDDTDKILRNQNLDAGKYMDIVVPL